MGSERWRVSEGKVFDSVVISVIKILRVGVGERETDMQPRGFVGGRNQQKKIGFWRENFKTSEGRQTDRVGWNVAFKKNMSMG